MRVLRALFVATVVALAASTVAQAHNLPICGSGNLTKYFRSYTYHSWPGTWSSDWQTALNNATSEFNVGPFKWYSGSTIQWANLNSSDTTIAGYATVTYTCGNPIIVTDADLYVNFPHFQASTHTIGQRHCTAIHEMGHATGLGHNELASIEYVTHTQRCHNWEVKKLQTHDISDLNIRYQ